MKAIMVMYDSLNRHMLSPYGCDWTQTPNFKRLADRCVTFDKCYVGSLTCMPHGGKSTQDVTISCTEAGAPWNPTMIPCRKS